MALHKTDVVSDEVKALAADLKVALNRDFGKDAFLNPDGWALEEVALRSFLTVSACAVFSRDGRDVCIIVRPTDPASDNAYFRTARYDLAYYFENVAEDERPSVWQSSRGLIDGFAAWHTAQAQAK